MTDDGQKSCEKFETFKIGKHLRTKYSLYFKPPCSNYQVEFSYFWGCFNFSKNDSLANPTDANILKEKTHIESNENYGRCLLIDIYG